MAIMRPDIATSLQYGVRAGFLDARSTYTRKRQLFVVETDSTGKSETYVGLGANPMPRELVDSIVPKGLGERNVAITNKDWEISLAVEDNAINDDRVGHVLRWARDGGVNFEKHMDKLSLQALNGGDGTTYGLCYDGLNFFSASHVDPSAEYTTVQSNLPNLGALTFDNFNTAYVAMLNFLDDRGEPADIVPDLLVVAPALKQAAAQICVNNDKPGTANRDINPFAGEMSYLVSPYFDSTAWALVASGGADKPIIFQMRQQPELEIVREGRNNLSIYKFVARYNVGYGNWRLALLANS